MRIYIPLTCSQMADLEISPRIVHSVTPQSRRAFLEADDESLEMLATLYAADESVLLMRDDQSTAPQAHALPGSGALGESGELDRCVRRIVAVGEVPDSWVQPFGQDERDECAFDVPTAVRLIHAVPWEKIESIHVDEPGNEGLVRRAIEGDEGAFEASGDIELLWYDVTEREFLVTELGGS